MLLWRATGIALLIYLTVFAGVVIPWKGVAKDYQTQVVFWGSILRPQDLLTEKLVDPVTDNIRLVEPSLALLRKDREAWRAQVLVDKPFERRSLSDLPVPLKFATQRVEVDNDPVKTGETGVDPQSPRVSLRMPQP